MAAPRPPFPSGLAARAGHRMPHVADVAAVAGVSARRTRLVGRSTGSGDALRGMEVLSGSDGGMKGSKSVGQSVPKDLHLTFAFSNTHDFAQSRWLHLVGSRKLILSFSRFFTRSALVHAKQKPRTKRHLLQLLGAGPHRSTSFGPTVDPDASHRVVASSRRPKGRCWPVEFKFGIPGSQIL